MGNESLSLFATSLTRCSWPFTRTREERKASTLSLNRRRHRPARASPGGTPEPPFRGSGAKVAHGY
jgi:hypothetical protein